jgi:hypothetical protein
VVLAWFWAHGKVAEYTGEIAYAAYASRAYLREAPDRPRLVGYDERLAGLETERLARSYPDAGSSPAAGAPPLCWQRQSWARASQ